MHSSHGTKYANADLGSRCIGLGRDGHQILLSVAQPYIDVSIALLSLNVSKIPSKFLIRIHNIQYGVQQY